MRKILSIAILLFLFFSTSNIRAETKEGQKLTDFIALGFGASAPLPEGTWLVKSNRSYYVNSALYDGFLLENLDPKATIPFIIVQVGRVPREWGYRSGSIIDMGPNVFLKNSYGTTASNSIMKLSGFYPLTSRTKEFLKDSTSLYSRFLNFGFDVSQLKGLDDQNFLMGDIRIIAKNEAVRLNLFVKLNEPDKSLQLSSLVQNSQSSGTVEKLDKWLSTYTESLNSSYYLRKPQNIFALNLSSNDVIVASNSLGASADEIKKVEQQRILADLKLQEDLRIKTEEERSKAEKQREIDNQKLAMEIKAREDKLKEDKIRAQEMIDLKERQRQSDLQRIADANRTNTGKPSDSPLTVSSPGSPSDQLSKTDQYALLTQQLDKLKKELVTAEALKTNKPAASRKALVFGNDKYLNINPLENAAFDASSMGESLKSLGYDVTLKLNATQKEMISALRNFKATVKPGDEVTFFYAGHGVQLGQSNFILPIDITGESEDQIKDDAVPLDRILDDMSERKAKFTLVVVDACRDNPFKSNKRSIGAATRGLAPTNTANGQMIVFSAGTGQRALDKLGPNDKEKNGVFTRIFIKEMQKDGASIDRVVRNVRGQVVELAKSVNHEQVPAIYDQVIGEFYFK